MVSSWPDHIISSFEADRIASLAMTTHASSRPWDKTEWPHHSVYSARQGQGMLFASHWRDHEGKIRQFIKALPADQYYPLNPDADKTISDPALRTNAHEIVPRLARADRASLESLTGIMEEAETVEPTALAARIAVIDDVRPHGENLSIVTVSGNEVVANRRGDGSLRWAKGEICVYVPEGMIIPDDLLKERGYWDDEKNRGMLDGKKRNLVKMRRFAGHESRGLLLKVGLPETPWFGDEPCNKHWIDRGDQNLSVDVGDDVSDFLGITVRVVG